MTGYWRSESQRLITVRLVVVGCRFTYSDTSTRLYSDYGVFLTSQNFGFYLYKHMAKARVLH